MATAGPVPSIQCYILQTLLQEQLDHIQWSVKRTQKSVGKIMNFITAINTMIRIHICERFQFTGILSQMLWSDLLHCLLFIFMTGNKLSKWPASTSLFKKKKIKQK